MVTQSRLTSIVEVCLNVGSGFVLAFIVWQGLAWWYVIDMPLTRNLQITTIFTVLSIARGYVWRRIFNRRKK